MVRLNQHLLAHTSGRLGLIFSQQTVEMVINEGPIEAEVSTPKVDASVDTPVLEADVYCTGANNG